MVHYDRWGRRRKHETVGRPLKHPEGWVVTLIVRDPIESAFTERECLGALHKSWRAFNLYRRRGEYDGMYKYAKRVRFWEALLGFEIRAFPMLAIYGNTPDTVDYNPA